MQRAGLRRVFLALFFFLFAGVPMMPAQWVRVARAASNRIQHMTQKSSGGGYDVATVILTAPVARVLEKAITTLHGNPDIAITKDDSKNGKIQFERGKQAFGLQISALNDDQTQVVVAASVSEGATGSGKSEVVDAILRICNGVNVQCTVQGD